MVLRIVLILENTNNLQMSLKNPIFKLTTKVKLIFLRPLKKLKRIYIYNKNDLTSYKVYKNKNK